MTIPATPSGTRRKTRANATAIGAFLVGAIIIIVAGILLFGAGNPFGGATRAVIFFQGSVKGLNPGAPVTFRGVQVGSVQRLALRIDPNTDQAVIPVYVQLSPDKLSVSDSGAAFSNGDIATLVARGLRARLQWQSLVTGQSLIDLDFIPNAGPAPKVSPGVGVPEIPAVKSQLEQLREKVMGLPVRDTLTQARAVLAELDALTAKATTVLAGIGSNVGQLSAATTSLAATTEGTVRDLQTELEGTLRDLRAFLQTGQAQLGTRGAELGKASEAMTKAADRVSKLAGNLNDLFAPHSGARSDLETMLRELASAAVSLHAFARQIERNPNSLLLGTRK